MDLNSYYCSMRGIFTAQLRFYLETPRKSFTSFGWNFDCYVTTQPRINLISRGNTDHGLRPYHARPEIAVEVEQGVTWLEYPPHPSPSRRQDLDSTYPDITWTGGTHPSSFPCEQTDRYRSKHYLPSVGWSVGRSVKISCSIVRPKFEIWVWSFEIPEVLKTKCDIVL